MTIFKLAVEITFLSLTGKEAVYFERVSELDEISQKRDRARKRHDDLRKTRLNEFMEGFGIITAKLKEMYQVCTIIFVFDLIFVAIQYSMRMDF